MCEQCEAQYRVIVVKDKYFIESHGVLTDESFATLDEARDMMAIYLEEYVHSHHWEDRERFRAQDDYDKELAESGRP